MSYYEYSGLMAQSWDVLRGDTSTWPDRDFYLTLIRRSDQPILDVGCGTDRLLLDYGQLGIDIDGEGVVKPHDVSIGPKEVP